MQVVPSAPGALTPYPVGPLQPEGPVIPRGEVLALPGFKLKAY